MRTKQPLSSPLKDAKTSRGEGHRHDQSGDVQCEQEDRLSSRVWTQHTASCSHYLHKCQRRLKDDKIAFPMIGLSGMANLGFLKMNIFKMEISAPDGKQTSEELNFICRGKKKKIKSSVKHNPKCSKSLGKTVLPVCSKLQKQGHRYLCWTSDLGFSSQSVLPMHLPRARSGPPVLNAFK